MQSIINNSILQEPEDLFTEYQHVCLQGIMIMCAAHTGLVYWTGWGYCQMSIFQSCCRIALRMQAGKIAILLSQVKQKWPQGFSWMHTFCLCNRWSKLELDCLILTVLTYVYQAQTEHLPCGYRHNSMITDGWHDRSYTILSPRRHQQYGTESCFLQR